MSSIRLRILTRKSILGFSYFDIRDLSVQMIIDLDKISIIIRSYYNLDKISFAEDILEELCIDPIEKPGKIKDKDLSYDKVRTALNLYYNKQRLNMTDEEKLIDRVKRNSISKGTIHSKSKRRYSNNKLSRFLYLSCINERIGQIVRDGTDGYFYT